MELAHVEKSVQQPEDRNARRDELDIIIDLLLNSMQTVRSTHILYKTNLGYNQMKKYLVILVRLGLIEQTVRPFKGFKITQKGRAFIDLLGPAATDRIKRKGVDSLFDD